jgi:elongation factor Ts
MSTHPEPAPKQKPISSQLVKALRERTGAGFSDCRAALQEANGDLEVAANILRKRGQAAAQKKAQRQASQGAVGSYIHAGGRIGVLVEVNCESDFVARTDEFQRLCHDLAMHVAALDPRFVSRHEIPAELLEIEREKYRAEARAVGKPEHIIEKIVAGKLEKFFEETCLYEQHFIKDETLTIKEVIEQMIAKVGENIALRRFARFKVGEPGGAADAPGVSVSASAGPENVAGVPESTAVTPGKPGTASASS